MNTEDSKQRIKGVMVDELMLDIGADESVDVRSLFSPDGLGLDSVDVIQLVVARAKHFGPKLSDAEAARGVLTGINRIHRPRG